GVPGRPAATDAGWRSGPVRRPARHSIARTGADRSGRSAAGRRHRRTPAVAVPWPTSISSLGNPAIPYYIVSRYNCTMSNWKPTPQPVTGRDVSHLADFTANRRVLTIIALALPIGAVGAGLAWVLLRLIAVITNAVFYNRFGTALVAP